MARYFNFWRCAIITVCIFMSASMMSVSAETTIRLGYSDAEAFPYQISQEANPPGIAFEIIEQAAKELGVKVVFVKLPNKRVLYSLQKNQGIDGAFMYSFKTERQEDGQYPMKNGKTDDEKRIATLSYYVYKLKDSPLKWDGKAFSGVDVSSDKNNIGANMGYSIVADLVKLGVKVDEGSKTTEQNFKKLTTTRICGYAHQDLVADEFISSSGLKDVEKLPVPLVKKPYFLLFSHQFMKDNPEIAQKMWDKISSIRESVTKKVLKKYLDK